MADLSIVVPVYNGERYLAQLLDSICAICKVSIEVVMVNDGSADGSEQIIREYQKKDSRIAYYSKENGGIVSARNYGLDKATGKYIFFADQDDKLDAKVVEEAVKRLEKEQADMLFFSTEYFDDAGKKWACDTVYEEGIFEEYDVGNIFIRKLVARFCKKEVLSYVGHIWAAIIRREMVAEQNVQFKRFIAIEDDLLFILDSLDNAKRVLTMKETGYYWRQNPSSRTRQNIYCESFAEKKRLYYEYRTSALNRHEVCNAEEYANYCMGVRQEFMLDMLDNEAILPFWKNGEAVKRMQSYLAEDEIKKAMCDNPYCPLATRFVTEKRLLMQGKIRSAILYKKFKYAKACIGNWVRRMRYLFVNKK